MVRDAAQGRPIDGPALRIVPRAYGMKLRVKSFEFEF
jgi:hypothetical protein